MLAASFYCVAAQPFSSGTSSTRMVSRRSCRISNTGKQLEAHARRSANYHPTIWDHQTIQSFESPYSSMGQAHDGHRQQLKLQVKLLLDASKDTLDQLRLVDSIQRLGVAYHFKDEIKGILDIVHVYHSDLEVFEGVYETALAFRLLRQHGYYVSSDVFHRYRDETKGFKDYLTYDVMGLLSLYEASYLALTEDKVLEEANKFTVRHLKNLSQELGLDIENQVRLSLQVPLHWRMGRLETRHYIDVYERVDGMSSILLEFAKMDFNFVQVIHQQELKELSKWWKNMDLSNMLEFSRDRLVENYLWAVGIVTEPHWSKCRIGLTKLICIFTIVDDIYDIYGFLEEVEIFTKVVKSWDPQYMGSLPKNFKLCYRVLSSLVEEIATEILVEHGCEVMPLLKKEWETLCGAYLVEAKWFHKGDKPSLKEYLKNAWISVGGPLVMVYAYCLQGHILRDNSLNCLRQDFDLIYWSSLITRLNNDLGTSKAEMERGDTLKSIQCHMMETNKPEKYSKEYICSQVELCWKKFNKECLRTQLPQSFVNMVTNMARASHCIFQHGDGIGNSRDLTKNHILFLFVSNVPFE